MSWPSMTDYQEAIQNPFLCFSDSVLKSGSPELDSLGLPKPMTGSFASVYQINCKDKKYAAKCFLTDYPELEKRYSIISRYLHENRLPYMVDFDFLRQGIMVRGRWYPILKMEWIDGEIFNSYVQRNLQNSRVILDLADKFLRLIRDLKYLSIAHGDLQPGNIKIVNGDLRLLDYDGIYVPGLEGLPSNELGLPNFQHPRRSEQDFGPYLDNFSAWVIYVSLIAFAIEPDLWNNFGASEESLLFRREDFLNPITSKAFLILDNLQDDGIQPLIAAFKSAIYCSRLDDIPSLADSSASALSVGTAQTAVSAARPKIRGGSWVWDPISVPKKHIESSFKVERFSLVALALITGLLGYVTAKELPEPSIVVLETILCIAAEIAALNRRFESTPIIKERSELAINLQRLDQEIRGIEKALVQFNNDRDGLEREERQRISEAYSRQQTSLTGEKSEVNRIEMELREFLRKVDSQRQILGKAEITEKIQASSNFQNRFLIDKLSQHSISSSNITGIDIELQNQLAKNGIRTAADISNIFIPSAHYHHKKAIIDVPGRGRIHVDGIGPTRARALMSWHQILESQYSLSMPQSISREQELAIESKYKEKRQELIMQEVYAKLEASRKKDLIHEKYIREGLSQALSSIKSRFSTDRQDLDKRNNELRNNYSEKTRELAKGQQELRSYMQIRFTNFLKDIIFLKNNRYTPMAEALQGSN